MILAQSFGGPTACCGGDIALFEGFPSGTIFGVVFAGAAFVLLLLLSRKS